MAAVAKALILMSTIPCTWEEFKQLAKEFHQAAPTLNLDELDNAWKCLGHAYVGMTDERFWAHSAIKDIIEGAEDCGITTHTDIISTAVWLNAQAMMLDQAK